MNKPSVANAETEACEGCRRSTESIVKRRDFFNTSWGSMEGRRSSVLEEEGGDRRTQQGRKIEMLLGSGNTLYRQTL